MYQEFFLDVVYSLIRFFVGPVVRMIWVKNVTGIENIPMKGPAIIAFNHQSYFDFICFIAVSPRNIHYLSAEKFFRHPIWKLVMKITGQIRVDRISKDKHELHFHVHEHLDAGKVLGVFPEGTRSPHKEEMLKGFPGAVRYAIQKNAPVIPVGIKGTYEILPKHGLFPRLKKCVEIVVGDAVYFEKYQDALHDKKVLETLTHDIMIKISQLSGKKYPYVVL